MTNALTARRRVLLIGIGVVALLVAATLSWAGWSIWPLITVVGAVLVLGFGQLASWTGAVVASATALLIGDLLLLRLTAVVQSDIAVTLTLGLLLAGVVALLAVGLRRPGPRLPDRVARRGLAEVLVAPALVAVVALVVAVATSGERLSWVMNGDAMTNTMLARFMWADGGIDTTAHPNAATLTQAMLLSVWAPGRAGLDTAVLLGHDLPGNAQVVLITTVLAVLLSAVVVHRLARRLGRLDRVVAAVLGGLVPLGFVLATSLVFGFYNGPITAALLAGAWLAWEEAEARPAAGLAMLAMIATVLLGGWAPLAIIPLALGLAVLVRARLRVWRPFDGERWWLVAAGAVLAGYVVAIVVPDLLAMSDGLGVDGGMAPFTPWAMAAVAVVAVLVAAIDWAWRGRIGTAIGVGTIVLATVVALGYLVWQRRDAAGLWGYYPEKFSWLVSGLLVLIVLGAVLGWSHEVRGRAPRLGLQIAAIVVALGLMVQLPPSRPALDAMIATVDLRPETAVAEYDDAVQDLIALSDPDDRVLVARWGGYDRTVNAWLVHMTVTEERDPIRLPSYFLDADDPAQLCDIIRVWGGGVTVHTRDAALEGQLAASCGDLDLTVALASAQTPAAAASVPTP